MKKVEILAEKIVSELKPFCKKIKIVGSIRRHSTNPQDIDIVLIPKDKIKLEEIMETKAKFIQGGEYKSSWRINKTKVELYYTNEDEWGAELLAYSSKKGAGIGLRVIAKKKGFHLTQHGLFSAKTGKRVASRTEKEIYSALGRSYKSPRDR